MLINSISYKVESYSAPEDHLAETIKTRVFIDGGISIINFGARKKYESSFKLVNIAKADFVSLVNYLIAQAGNKVLLTVENDGEKIFSENVPGGGIDTYTYYVYILEPSSFQEEDFSITDDLYTLNLKVALAGTTADAVPNETDSSLVDVLIEVDTTAGATKGGTVPASPSLDDRWLDVDAEEGSANILYKCIDPDGVSFALTWKALYTVTGDDADVGFKSGSFYLSYFSDLTYDSNDYKVGILSFDNITIPGMSVDISNGPSLSRKDGFQFSVKNIDSVSVTFWKFIVDNNINIYGAVCKIGIWQSGDIYTQFMAGKNKTNSFNYTDYVFKVEPHSLNDKGVFPLGNISAEDARYTDVKAEAIGKVPYATYGEFEFAALQNVSPEQSIFEINDIALQHDVVAFQVAVDFASQLKLLIYKSLYTINTTVISFATLSSGEFALKVRTDSLIGSENPDNVRVIESFEDEPFGYTGFYVITIKKLLPTPPTNDAASPPGTNDRLTIQVLRNTYKYQIDDETCEGFGTAYDSNIEVFRISQNQKQIEKVVNTGYTESVDGTTLLLTPDVALDTTEVDTYRELILYSDQSSGLKLGSFLRCIPDGFKEDTVDLEVDSLSGYSALFYRQDYIQSLSTLGKNYNVLTRRLGIQNAFDTRKISNTLDATLEDLQLFTVLSINNGWTVANDLMGGSIYTFKVSHNEADTAFLLEENARLCLNLKVISTYWVRKMAGTIKPEHPNPMPFKMKIRFKKKDGTYIDSVDWEYDVEANKFGPYSTMYDGFPVKFSNRPSSNLDVGFTEDTTTLPDNYDYMLAMIFETEDEMNRAVDRKVWGDLCWVVATGQIYKYNGTSYDVYKEHADLNVGDILFCNIDSVTLEPVNNLVYKIALGDDPSYPGSTYRLDVAVAGTDYETTPEAYGRDLIDISSLFDEANLWSDVDEMHLIFLNLDFSTSQNNDTSSIFSSYSRIWDLKIIEPSWFYLSKRYDFSLYGKNVAGVPSPFSIFGYYQTEVIDTPLFASVKGRKIDGTFSSLASDITTNLLDKNYPGMYNTASLTTLFSGDRSTWKFRRQFLASLSSENLLEELALNLWATAIINAEDEIELKSLDEDDMFDVSLDLTDSNILEDSFSDVEYRDSNEIYQAFRLEYNFQVPSEFSKALKAYEGFKYVSKDEGELSWKTLLNASGNLYNLNNTFEKKFIYHYENLPMVERIIKWFGFNYWKFSVGVTLETILGSGALSLMDSVSVTSYIHTGNVKTYGFVVGIKPDFFNGIAILTIYVPSPIGKTGVLCDPFNDALNVGSRNITGWTNANGKLNDAGNLATRNILDYTIKDAGNVETREFCT